MKADAIWGAVCLGTWNFKEKEENDGQILAVPDKAIFSGNMDYRSDGSSFNDEYSSLAGPNFVAVFKVFQVPPFEVNSYAV